MTDLCLFLSVCLCVCVWSPLSILPRFLASFSTISSVKTRQNYTFSFFLVSIRLSVHTFLPGQLPIFLHQRLMQPLPHPCHSRRHRERLLRPHLAVHIIRGAVKVYGAVERRGGEPFELVAWVRRVPLLDQLGTDLGGLVEALQADGFVEGERDLEEASDPAGEFDYAVVF